MYKKMFRVALIVCHFVFISSQVIGQSYFEGEILYSVEYLSIPDDMKNIKDYLPTEMQLLSKGTKYKTISLIPGKTDQVVIMDNFDGSGYMLMEFLGHKIALSNDPSEVRKINALYFQSEIISEDGSKEFLGYDCQKAKLINEKDTTDLFYTTEHLSPEFKYSKLKGLPLEYTSHEGDLVIKVVAIKVTPKEVSDLEFVIPEDYEEMTREKLQEMFEM